MIAHEETKEKLKSVQDISNQQQVVVKPALREMQRKLSTTGLSIVEHNPYGEQKENQQRNPHRGPHLPPKHQATMPTRDTVGSLLGGESVPQRFASAGVRGKLGIKINQLDERIAVTEKELAKRDSFVAKPPAPLPSGHKQNASMVDPRGPTSFATLYNKRSDNMLEVQNTFERMQLHRQLDR